MISDEAVEAAAKVILRGTDEGHHAYKIAYAALEAAAPHMASDETCWLRDVRTVIPAEAVEREELAELIARRRYAKNARPSVWITGRAALEVADVILAAGYRKVDP